MACRHAKGGICTCLACPKAGEVVPYCCEGCRFAEEPGERRPRRPALKQLAVEAYTGPIPEGAVRCKRCGRPCKTGSPDPKARMLRISAGTGFCLDCAVTDWLRNTYPVNLLLGAAPLLGTKRAVADQERWDEMLDVEEDYSPLGMCDLVITERDPLGKALVAGLHGDMGPLDAMTAEREEREARRARSKAERADRHPERKLLSPAIREGFRDIMVASFAQARWEDIDWEWIVENWSLPFPKARGNQGACAP